MKGERVQSEPSNEYDMIYPLGPKKISPLGESKKISPLGESITLTVTGHVDKASHLISSLRCASLVFMFTQTNKLFYNNKQWRLW